MLKLVPMSESEFAEYESETRTHYASDVLKADGGSPDTAVARATQAFLKLLPEGQDTPDHHFFTLLTSEMSAAVGWLWLREETSERGRGAFVYDLLVLPQYRDQGYGRCALQAAEAWASELAMQYIDLHVFGHNTGAQRLYAKAGYQATHISMTKALS
ncbi:GNAT family N-acetyltransferase [Caballeronia sp.]|uniref:GNAT family N-acetyltransferase n=1 Tax=Caballeronia sp. TaxID=1931223 RepID=UPI003C527136